MRKPRHKPKSIPPNLPVLVRSDGHEVALPEDIVAAAKEHATKARAPATLKAYGVWLRDFQGWCEAHGRDAYPANPATVTGYVTALAARGLSISTIDQAVAAIKDVVKGMIPKKNMLPLELQNCYMEIHRKEQNLTPLFNQIRNDTIADMTAKLEKL